MAKKKGKKGKKKGKKKGNKSKKMSALEKVTFKLLIETLENKIAWRKEMCKIIEEDIELYQKAYEEERKDKTCVVALLEKAIQEQSLIRDKIRSAIPDAEKDRLDMERAQSKDLALALKGANSEISDDGVELKKLQGQLKMLQTYDADRIQRKITETESKLDDDKEDELTRAMEMKQRQEKDLEDEMAHVFEKKSLDYQESLKGRLHKNVERIAEETRWWKDSGSILNTMRERLEKSNKSKSAALTKDKEDLRKLKQSVLKTSLKLQEQERKISALQTRNLELQQEKEEEEFLREEKRRLSDQKESTESRLLDLKQKFRDSLELLQKNESKIKELECEVASAEDFGDYLDEVLDSAKNIIAEDVKHSIIKTYDGPPERKNILIELDFLFNEATKVIYEQTTQDHPGSFIEIP